MNLCIKHKRINQLFTRLIVLPYSIILLMLAGCVPVISTTYKTPQVEATLFTVNSEINPYPQPLSDAKIYHIDYPETAVYSDSNGQFLLTTNSAIEAKLLMPGHSLTYYPIVIEHGSVGGIIYAQATFRMNYLEEVNLGSIVITKDKESVDLAMKQAWPCDLSLIKNLDKHVDVAMYLQQQNSPATTKFDLKDHYQQLLMIADVAENSCHWQEISDQLQFQQRSETKEYFSNITKLAIDYLYH